MNFKKASIEDVCDFVGGSQPPKSVFKSNREEGYIRLIQTRDYKTDGFITYIPKNLARRFCHKNDIMIGRYGPPVFQIFRGLEGAYNVALMKAVPKPNILNDYLYYLLKQEDIFIYVDRLSKRTGGQTGVDLDSLNKYPILLPSLDYQERVVGVLKALDNKIAINNRINNELEEMAKTLYDYWFVQWDFPDAYGKPYKTSGGKMVYSSELKREIPIGWNVKELNRLTEVSNATVNPLLYLSKQFKHYSIPVYDASGGYSIEAGEKIKSNKFTVDENDILVSKLNPWFSRVIYSNNEDDVICSTEFVVWRTANTNLKNYLYFIAKNQAFISYCTKSATGTSNSHKRVNPTVMMKFKVGFNKEIAEKFGATINPWLKMIFKNQKENQQLTELRDWLLPMLMNGQVTVTEAEERVAMAAEPEAVLGKQGEFGF